MTFDWSYDSSDESAAYDWFGYILGGSSIFDTANQTKLTSDGGGTFQSGSSVSFAVTEGELFGFYAKTSEGCCGSATTVVSNFSAPSAVPIPAAAWLFASGLIGLVGVARRKKV